MKIIKDASEIKLPEKFICPICSAKVVIDDIDEWEQNDDGTWQVSECGLHISCETEPQIGTPNWDGWIEFHFAMPYVDWLPIEEDVLRWINKNYRWKKGGA